MQRRHFLATAAASAATGMLLPGCDRAPRALEGGFTGIDMARGHQLRDLLKTGTLPAPSVVRRAQVIIAGGGVAGPAAARSLRLAGVEDFELLELEDTAGGNSRGGPPPLKRRGSNFSTRQPLRLFASPWRLHRRRSGDA